jgi:glycosyltransferase involved in cell wall biosynthesis
MDAARFRVLQVIPSLWHGGLEHVATILTLALAADPSVERVLVCSSGGRPYTEELQRNGIEIRRIARPYPRPGPLVRSAVTLARVLRRERPHVVHAHNPGATAAAVLARTLARTREIPIVATYHGVLEERIPRAARALGFADIVVGVSPTATKMLVEAGLPAAKSRTIFNAVDPHVRPEAEVRTEFDAVGRPLVVTVGRYVAEKNQALLLEALALLDRPIRGLVVGYGPRKEELRARTAELGLGETVTVTGERNDAPDLIAAADVFALSSSSEALPLVVIEAMAVGTPVVSTNVGGIADVVADGQTGLLVPSGDAPALAAAIARVLDEDGLGDRLQTEARRFVAEHCSLPAMVDAYRGVYTEAIARRAGARPST